MRRFRVVDGRLVVILCLMGGFLFGCRSTERLSEVERGKLDRPLRQFLEDGYSERLGLQTRLRPDGAREVAVVVGCTDMSVLRAAGMSIGSEAGEVATGWLTREELRAVVALEEVRYVTGGGRMGVG